MKTVKYNGIFLSYFISGFNRYGPPPGYPPNSHYMPPNYYPDGPSSAPPTGYRERYPSGSEWNRDRDYMDYRTREYDRRAPPPPSGNT